MLICHLLPLRYDAMPRAIAGSCRGARCDIRCRATCRVYDYVARLSRCLFERAAEAAAQPLRVVADGARRDMPMARHARHCCCCDMLREREDADSRRREAGYSERRQGGEYA